jgi:uncharacterized membrane protein
LIKKYVYGTKPVCKKNPNWLGMAFQKKLLNITQAIDLYFCVTGICLGAHWHRILLPRGLPRIAFYYNALHAVDYERLKIENNKVIIERKKGRQESEIQLTRAFTRIKALTHQEDIITLNQGVQEATFGYHIHRNYRGQVMRELRERL